MLLRIQLVYKITALFLNKYCTNRSIPNGTTFIPNSVTIDGVSQPNSNPENGISIGTLNPNQAKQLHSSSSYKCRQMEL